MDAYFRSIACDDDDDSLFGGGSDGEFSPASGEESDEDFDEDGGGAEEQAALLAAASEARAAPVCCGPRGSGAHVSLVKSLARKRMETFRPHPKTKAIRRERLAAVKRGDDKTVRRLDSAKTPDPILGLDPHKHRAMIIAKYSVEIADRVDAEVAPEEGDVEGVHAAAAAEGAAVDVCVVAPCAGESGVGGAGVRRRAKASEGERRRAKVWDAGSGPAG